MNFFNLTSLKFFAAAFLFFVSFQTALAQPVSSVSNVKDACDGLNNGSFDVTINSPGTTAPYSIFVFGLSFGQIVTVSNIPSDGVPVSITGLRADNYLINVGDSDPSTSNYSTFQTINADPTISATIDSGSPSDNSSCSSPNGFVHITVTGGSGNFTYSWTSTNGFTASTQDIDNLAGGSYSVSIVDKNTNCTRSLGPYTVNDPSPLTYNVATTTPTICLNNTGTVTLSNSESASVSYQVFKGGVLDAMVPAQTGVNGLLTFTIPAADLTPAGTYNFTIQATNGACTPVMMNGTAAITVNPKPTSATLSAVGPTTICVGASTTIKVDVVGGTANYNFTITNGPAEANYVSGASISVSPASTTTYDLTGVTVTDSKGCTVSGTGSVAVTVNPVPTVVITNPAAVCSPSTVDLTAAAVTAGSTAGLTYTYWTDALATSPLASPNAVSVSGTYYIKGTSAANCFSIQPVTVTINPKPTSATLSAVGSTNICAGASTTIKVTIAGGTPNYNFTITNGPVEANYVSGTSISVTPASTTTYDLTGVTVTDSKGCTVSGTGSVAVTVNPVPTVTITNPAPVCSPSTVDLTAAAVTAGSTAGLTYTYWTDALATSPLASPSAVSVSGTYYIKGTSAAGCSAIQPVTVTINPKPTSATLSAVGSTNICAGASTTIKVTIAGGTPNYNFTITNGPVEANYVSGTSISVTPASTTTYDLTGVTVTDSKGCTVSGTGSVAVTVNPIPTVTITNPAPVCSPSTVDLTAAAVTAGSTAGLTYTYWTDALATSPLASPNAVSVSGTYYIKGTSAAGCSAIQPVTVTINPKPTSATLSAVGSTNICTGASTTIKVDIVGGTPNYNFTITNGPTEANYVTGTSISVTPASTTTYNLTGVTVTDSKGCTVSGTGSATVTVNPVPTVSITNPAPVCSPSTVDLTAAAVTAGSTAGLTYTYWTDALATSPLASPNAVSVSGTYYIKGTSGAGCSAIQPVTVTINPKPTSATLSAVGSTSICAGASTTIKVDIVGGTPNYNFTITNGPVEANYVSGTSISVTPASTTTYDLTGVTVTDSKGCTVSGTGSVAVTVNPVPTVSITNPAAVCSPSTVDLTAAAVTAGSTAGLTYTYWTDALATSPLAGPNAVSVSGTYYIKGTSAANCFAIQPVTATINPTPSSATLSAVGATSICAGASTTIKVDVIGGTANYNFTITNGPVESNYVSGTSISVTPASTTTYDLTGVTITDAKGCTVSGTGSVAVTVSSAPTVANAGPDQNNLCNTTTTTLAGNTPVVGVGAWTVVSGTATITTPSSPTSGVTGLTIGASATLRWTITSGSCTPSTDDVIITVGAPPTTSVAGPDQTICNGSAATLAANAPVVGTGAWSITSGPSLSLAQFSSTSNPGATFTSAGGAGAYVLTWTINNAPCPFSATSLTINVDAKPTVANAGADQGVCGSSTNLAGNTPSTGSGTWTITSGSGGSVTTPSSPTSAFTGTVGTAYTLRWTISNGVCAPSTDDVNIVFSTPPTTANAGNDQSICGTSLNLSGNVPASGSGTWSIISGSGGTITTPSSPTSSFSGTAGTTYQLRWTITNGACTPSTDDVTITFDKAPTVAAAGSDQSVCGTSATLAGNTPIVGTGLWTISSGAGGSIANASSPTSGFTGVAGTVYTLTWTISNGSCTASTDNVDITFDVAPTTADAGPDQPLCNVTTATLAGNTPTTGSGIWSVVSGTATITTPTSPTSGVTGLVVGASATLRWTISNGTCTASTDDVVITVAAPADVAAAGSDQTVCGPATLAANTPVVGIGAWSVVSGAGGSFSNAANPASTFTGTGGVMYTIRWTITSGTCPSTSDDVNITFDINSPTPSNAGPDQNVCGTSATLAANAPAVGTGAWTILSGSGGSFVDATDPLTVFNGVQGNSYSLRWTITNGVCTPSTDDVTVTFDQNPTTAAAGPDQTLCNTSVTLAANTPTIGTGAWSIVSGAGGSFANALDPLSGFTGTQGTSYQLRWTISNGSCTASTDDVMINIDQLPTTANAGGDQSVCSTSATMAANAPGVGTGAWTIVSGAGGSFVDATDPVTTFNGTQGTAYVLRWTISNGTCTASTDDVNITLDQTPTASVAGPDQTPCGPTTLAANAPVIGTGLWSITSGVGGSLANASSPTSGFSGTAGVAYTLQWTISNGSCAASSSTVNITFDANTPTTSNAGPDQNVCAVSATLAANTPTVGTGGWSIVSGAGGSFVDATNPATTFNGTSGTTYTLRWTITSVGGCTPSTDDVVITLNQTPTTAAAGADQSGCNITLGANTPVVGTGSWSIISGVGGSIASASNPVSGFTGTNGNTYTLRWTITNGGCTASTDDVSITINCVVSPNCGAFSITPSDTRPTCANQDDGTITLVVSGGTPNYITTLFDSTQNFVQTFVGNGPFTFINLSPSQKYKYTIKDQAGNVCTQQYSLPIQTNVKATASGFVDAICYNQAVGQATVTVTSGGTSPYEYSLDAGTTWISFTSPVTITNLMPAPAPYSILVRDGVGDQCPAQVSVTINNLVTDIAITSSFTNASCANNDGTVTINTVSGGSGPYTPLTFDAVDVTAPLPIIVSGLAAGPHTFKVTDGNGCVKSFPFTLTSPGYVDFTTVVTNPTCTGGGNDGKIDVTINTSGNFDVGITTDLVNIPPTFTYNGISNTVTPVTLGNLSQGIYFIVVKPNGALCSTHAADTIKGGPVAVDFDFKINDFVCFETKGTIEIYNVKGSKAVDFTYEIINQGATIKTGTITQLQILDTVILAVPDTLIRRYQVRLYQDQSASTGCASPITSAYKDFSISGPLRTSFDVTKGIHKPSQLAVATGSVVVTLANTFAPPYLLNLHLLSPDIPGQTNIHNTFDTQWVPLDSTRIPEEFFAGDLYAGLYQLSIVDKYGCTRTDTVVIKIDAAIVIPNIFTPNHDGYNDAFEVLNLPANSSITITNRWGKEVYKSNLTPSTDVIGSNNNSPGITRTIVWTGGAESDGIYYYTLNTPGKTYVGWVEMQH